MSMSATLRQWLITKLEVIDFYSWKSPKSTSNKKYLLQNSFNTYSRTLCESLSEMLRHKSHFSQWKKFSLPPTLYNTTKLLTKQYNNDEEQIKPTMNKARLKSHIDAF